MSKELKSQPKSLTPEFVEAATREIRTKTDSVRAQIKGLEELLGVFEEESRVLGELSGLLEREASFSTDEDDADEESPEPLQEADVSSSADDVESLAKAIDAGLDALPQDADDTVTVQVHEIDSPDPQTAEEELVFKESSRFNGDLPHESLEEGESFSNRGAEVLAQESDTDSEELLLDDSSL